MYMFWLKMFPQIVMLNGKLNGMHINLPMMVGKRIKGANKKKKTNRRQSFLTELGKQTTVLVKTKRKDLFSFW